MRYRLLTASLILMVFLAACAGPAPIPRPGQLLYVSTFDAFNEDWQQYEGRLAAQVTGVGVNPAMQLTIDDIQEGAFTLLEQEFSDFDLIVHATQVAGPNDNGFGVVFRHRDSRNFYLFMISGDGYYQVSRRLDGVDTVLSDWAGPMPIIQQGQATNTIRVIAQSSAFTFYINDVQVPLCSGLWNPAAPGECLGAGRVVIPTTPQLTDTAFPQGRIGLGARSFSEQGVVVRFDNLLVCGPQSTPPMPYRCEPSPEPL